MAAPACAAKRVGAAPTAPGGSSPELACTYSYGGESNSLRVPPTRDPYRVRPAKIEGRFELKVVYVAAPADVAGVSVYTYYVAADAPILIHEAKFPIRAADTGSYGFTGQQLVYDPRGRELEYHCAWLAR